MAHRPVQQPAQARPQEVHQQADQQGDGAGFQGAEQAEVQGKGGALQIPLPHRDVVRGAGVRFGLQRVVPPLLRVIHETAPGHRAHQLLSIYLLHVAQPARLRMRTRAEEIEIRPHVQRRAGTAAAIQQAKVDRGTAAVAGTLGDVAVGQQAWLVKVRVLQCLARKLARVVHPGHEGLHRAHRSIAVVDPQAPSICAQILLHLGQCLRHWCQQIAGRRLVAGYRRAGEVVRAGVADIHVDMRRQRADLHQSGAGCISGR
ncbi:hypothetical protein G6F57_015010 [Rhizopus arrhizus]|nr:hypothetical protein G6F57_015010 [Rhizopus arrhizus]